VAPITDDIPGLFLVSEVSVLATGRSLLSFISDMEQSAGREQDAPRHRYCTVQRHVVVGVIRTPCAAAVSVGVSRCSVGLRRLVRAQRLASRPDRVSPTLLAAASDTARAMHDGRSQAPGVTRGTVTVRPTSTAAPQCVGTLTAMRRSVRTLGALVVGSAVPIGYSNELSRFKFDEPRR
jgi:hypothetical protein